MFAMSADFQLKPEMMEEFYRLYRENADRVSMDYPGYLGVTFMVDQDNPTHMQKITFWESREQMMGLMKDPQVSQTMDYFMGFLTEPPTIGMYEVPTMFMKSPGYVM